MPVPGSMKVYNRNKWRDSVLVEEKDLRASWLQAKGVCHDDIKTLSEEECCLSILDLLGYHELPIWRCPTGRKRIL